MRQYSDERAKETADEIYFRAQQLKEREGAAVIFMSLPLYNALCARRPDFVRADDRHWFRGFEVIIYYSPLYEYIVAGNIVRSLA